MRVREMITHRLGLAETGLGFQLVAQAEALLFQDNLEKSDK